MSLLFPKGFDERLLWDDPLRSAADIGAVLRAEEVREYVQRYNLIIDRDNFIEDHLKGASYSMIPDRAEGWIVTRQGPRDKLELKANDRGEYFVVPPNSFVFIRLKELLRVPFYMIARFNLKIRYAYRGLLLGTGPQIDPGYAGRIYIPLHNFTNEEVDVYVNETFVSFEFARTTPLRFGKKMPKTLSEFYTEYREKLRLIEPEKLKRNNLEAYLDGARPYSALGVMVQEFHEMRDEFRRRKIIEWTAAVSIAVLVITYAASTVGLFYSVNERESRLQDQIHKVSLEQTQPRADLRAQMDTLSESVRKLNDEVELLKPKRTAVPSVSPVSTPKQ